MTWTIIFLIVVAIIAAVIFKLSKNRNTLSIDFPYKKIDTLFSPAERSFLGVLNQAIGEQVQIFGKVRVADVITPKKGMNRSQWQIAFNKISGKHFDFLLCDKNNLSVLCVIELNDKSHNSKKRQDRDAFLEGSCNTAGLSLVQIPAQATYSINELQQMFISFLPTEDVKPFEVEAKSTLETLVTEEPVIEVDKVCPKCSSEMVKKVAKKGKNIGKEFWACSEFPKCRHTEVINV